MPYLKGYVFDFFMVILTNCGEAQLSMAILVVYNVCRMYNNVLSLVRMHQY